MDWDESQRPSLTYRQTRLNVREKRTKLNIALSQWQLDKSVPLTIYSNNRARGMDFNTSRTPILWAGYINAVYFRRGLTCTLGLTNDLIDGGQPRAKNGF